ncbi:high affinity copper uptake protein 1-like isoform X5 [Amphibalanus amphitrite]|uniref:high affinity copper uptake protein 1-like isoform X5 n=1 Tax=Amphibalanus amphitrite TaxID=1232801 RepID=UPI001C90B013|nr:high affinity copper uptake protein 1-like isoform X5 [Amphibalanus amphitrite]XP_043230582.1 high affinity copper uptake protein 1-like isoform X5 [Amphibalanus amphitrite]
MDHSNHGMDHSNHAMDHSGHKMDHTDHNTNHSGHMMDHSAHADHGLGAAGAAQQVLNATLSAAATAASEVLTTVQQHVHGAGDHDHAAMGHDHAAMGHDHAAMGHDHSQHMAATGTAASHEMAGHSMAGHGMAMTFHFGVNEFVLFDAWHVTTAGGMVASCIGLFILALLYEGLKYKREDLLRKNATRSQFDTIRVPTDGGVAEVTTVSNAQRMLSKHHVLQTFLHAVQVVVGYFLMLAFMTYNVWLGIAITLGAAAGYFIFGSKKFVVVDVTEHCH